MSAANRIRNRERRPEATGLNNKQLVNFYCPITSETNPIHAFSSVLDATVQSGQSASNISTLHCVYCTRRQLDELDDYDAACCSWLGIGAAASVKLLGILREDTSVVAVDDH